MSVSGPMLRISTEDLLPVRHSARHARDVVTEACLMWDLGHLIGTATLIVSELVSNVVEHAGTMMTLEVTVHSGHLHLIVHDGSAEPPVMREDRKLTEPGGLGLRLVDANSAAWGFTPEAGGKAVWARLSVTRP